MLSIEIFKPLHKPCEHYKALNSLAKKWYVDLTWSLHLLTLFTKQIAYAKGQSQIIPKLRGTFEPPTTGAAAVETTELQKSIFNAPPSSIPAKPAETNGLKATEANLPNPPHGMKRPREEEEEEEEEKN